MPEGPQARQVANLIEKHAGERLIEIRHPVSRKPWPLRLPTVIERVETKGKNIFVYLASGEVIYNHMLMWGWWLPTIEAVGKKRLNTAFITDKGQFGYFGGGILKLITPDEAEAIKNKLGPDMLTAKSADEVLYRVRASWLPVGEALLDQNLISGIGNVYKSESLFVARINPTERADQVVTPKFEKLFTWLQPQMVADIKRPGKMVTTTREAAKAGNWNFVYRRFHQPCLICRTKIERIYQGAGKGRSTYFCPCCQAIAETP